MLDAFFFALTLLGIGFVAGYATREIISRKRRAEYLTRKPYLPRMMKVEVETAEATDDPSRASGAPFQHPPGAATSPAVADEERLHELLRRMQEQIRAKRHPAPSLIPSNSESKPLGELNRPFDFGLRD